MMSNLSSRVKTRRHDLMRRKKLFASFRHLSSVLSYVHGFQRFDFGGTIGALFRAIRPELGCFTNSCGVTNSHCTCNARCTCKPVMQRVKRAELGTFYLAPGLLRKRSGSHYQPVWHSQPISRRRYYHRYYRRHYHPQCEPGNPNSGHDVTFITGFLTHHLQPFSTT